MSERIGNSDRLEVEDLQFIKERLTVITRQVANCIEISRRYLSFLRRQAEDAPRVGVNQLLSDLGQRLRVHPSLGGNQFLLHPLPVDVVVQVHSTDLAQVLLNLAVNGFQCAPHPHLVEIRGQVLSEPLDLAALKEGPQDRFLNLEHFENRGPLLALSVRDTGPGIAPDVLPRIFEPYFTTKAPRHGTGLGLSIVLRLIQAAKGAVHVHTEVGAGTTVTLFLRTVSPPKR
jgi:signal transduction histidine kinase